MATITFLGTSASIPSKDRDNTSLVLAHKKEIWLIDCPGAAPQKLLKAGFDFKTIKKVIITHHHPDHIAGIVSLIHAQAFSDSLPITIFSSAPSIGVIKKLIRIFNLDRGQFPIIKFVDVCKNNAFFSDKDIKIEAIANSHTVKSFGVKFTFSKKVLFYTSDTKFSPRILKQAEPFNYLVHDCTASGFYFAKYPAIRSMHTSSSQLSRYLEKNFSFKLIPVHFLTTDKNEEKRMRKELSACSRQVMWARDGQTIKL